MQNAALAATNIPVRYSAQDVARTDLEATLVALANEGAAGNITIPHKEASARLMTRLTPLAERIGATNTFYSDADGGLVGDNTDVAGFQDLVTTVLGATPVGAQFAVLGAGGAAAAVLAAIESWEGCTATIYARNQNRATALAWRFSDVASAKSMIEVKQLAGDIVVNATPVGLNDDEMPAPSGALAHQSVVLDLICKAGETAWVRSAREAGHVASDGFPMLVGQGAAAFEIWFGTQPDREAMWRSLRQQRQHT